jgi:cytidylate kinase
MAGNTVYVKGNYVDIHDNQEVNLNIEKAEVRVEKTVSIVAEPLESEQAEKMKAALTEAQLLTDDWQPNALSGTERGLLAKTLSERLGIKDVWKVFGQLWNEKPETLRRNFNKALEQRKSLDFQDRLQNILS